MTRFVLGSLVAATASLVLALTIGASSAVGKTSKCMVINDRLDTAYLLADTPQPVQTAIDAAGSGDTLWIRGECPGPLVITKSLTLTGQQIAGFSFAPTIRAYSPTMRDVSSVVHVIGSDVQLQINSLTLTGGGNLIYPVERGGGIWNEQGHLSLNNVTVFQNVAMYGGGIYNDHGTVEMSNSTIDTNWSRGGQGAGIYTAAGTLTIDASEIMNGYADNGGAIGVNVEWQCEDPYPCTSDGPGAATVVLTDTKIHDNTVLGDGGGIIATYQADITLAGTTEVTANHANHVGGGVWLSSKSTLRMEDGATIHGNSAGLEGGGIFAFAPLYGYPGTTLIDCEDGVNVYGNTPNNIYLE